MSRRTTRTFFSLTLFMLCCACWGHSLFIYSKANLAQVLITQSWNKTLAGEQQVRPWAWADTWPVARLEIPSIEHHYYVLAGSHGSSLAFGPGHLDGSAEPGERGTTVISGHRDTHFSFLEYLALNSVITLQGSDGKWTRYRVIERHITNIENGPWQINKDKNELHLVTCYPFNSPIPGGNLRHITIAKKINDSSLANTDLAKNPLTKSLAFMPASATPKLAQKNPFFFHQHANEMSF